MGSQNSFVAQGPYDDGVKGVGGDAGGTVSLDREERAVRGSSEASEFSASAGIQRAWDLAPAWSESTERLQSGSVDILTLLK
jgi:hypothetical protein